MAAVVVGVSHIPGIGYAVAKRFAREGLKVGIVGRQEDRLTAAQAEIQSSVPGAAVAFAVADATDREAVQAAVAKFAAAHGPASVLVYNIAPRPFPKVTVAELDPARLESDFRTSVVGALNCVQAVLPPMREAGSGTLLFTGATASIAANANFGPFAVAKGALRTLAQSLAKELLPEGIHVAHVVVDGMVDMPMIKSAFPSAEEGRLLDTEAISEAYWILHKQPPRCFTFELDVRPFKSQW